VDLVGDDAHAVPFGEGGDGGQLAGGVHGSGRVVRAAQQVGGPAAAGDRFPAGVLQPGEIDPQVGAERGLGHLPVHVGDELEERRIHGRVDHHRVAGTGHQLQHLDDAQHHVRHDRGPLHGEPVPAPPLGREPGQRLGVVGARRVPGVAEGEGVGDRPDDRLGQGDVHLGHPHRQHVLGVGAPFHAGTAAQPVQAE
jgi:hypothetical protein